MAKDLKFGSVTVERDSEEHPLNGTDEPVFVLRAQDKLALPIIHRYKVMLAQVEGIAPETVASVEGVLDEFDEFRTMNANRMKVPD